MALIHNIEHYRSRPLVSGALALQPIPQARVENRPQVCFVPKTEGLGQHTKSLAQEVQKITDTQAEQFRSHTQTETPWYEAIPGFFTPPQIERFLRRIQEKMSEGKSYHDALSFASVEVEQDVHGYEDEYIRQLAGLKWNIGWNDVQKLQGLDYNGETLQDLTSRQERDGVLYDSWFTDRPEEGKLGIESWLRTAPVGSKVLLISPSGWSGYEGFDYPQTQIYYVEVGEGKTLKSFTLRYDVPIEDNERLQKEAGMFVPEFRNERDRIKHMLRSPIFIAPDGTPIEQDGTPKKTPNNKTITSPEDVIDLMQQVRGSATAYEDPMFGQRTFDDMRALIRNPELFTKRHELSDEVVTTFQEYAAWELQQGHNPEETMRNLEIALGVILVKIKQLYLGESKQTVQEHRGSRGHVTYAASHGIFQNNSNYHHELEDMSKLPGCAGGGEKKKSRLQSMGGSREIESSSSGTVHGTCPGCGQEVEATIEDCKTICPNDDIPCIWSKTGRAGGSVRREDPQEELVKKMAVPKVEEPLKDKVSPLKKVGEIKREDREERRRHEQPVAKAA